MKTGTMSVTRGVPLSYLIQNYWVIKQRILEQSRNMDIALSVLAMRNWVGKMSDLPQTPQFVTLVGGWIYDAEWTLDFVFKFWHRKQGRRRLRVLSASVAIVPVWTTGPDHNRPGQEQLTSQWSGLGLSGLQPQWQGLLVPGWTFLPGPPRKNSQFTPFLPIRAYEFFPNELVLLNIYF
jgi:hypothetical protein